MIIFTLLVLTALLYFSVKSVKRGNIRKRLIINPILLVICLHILLFTTISSLGYVVQYEEIEDLKYTAEMADLLITNKLNSDPEACITEELVFVDEYNSYYDYLVELQAEPVWFKLLIVGMSFLDITDITGMHYVKIDRNGG